MRSGAAAGAEQRRGERAGVEGREDGGEVAVGTDEVDGVGARPQRGADGAGGVDRVQGVDREGDAGRRRADPAAPLPGGG